MTDRAAPSLALARDLRRAIQRRVEALAPAIEAYDFATDQDSRHLAGAQLMVAIEETDREFAQAKTEAVHNFDQAESAPPTERTP